MLPDMLLHIAVRLLCRDILCCCASKEPTCAPGAEHPPFRGSAHDGAVPKASALVGCLECARMFHHSTSFSVALSSS
eukprot:6589345-Pyramimonas_sp.AAC.1